MRLIGPKDQRQVILQDPVAEKHYPTRKVAEHSSIRVKKTWVTRYASFIPSSPNYSSGRHSGESRCSEDGCSDSDMCVKPRNEEQRPKLLLQG